MKNNLNVDSIKARLKKIAAEENKPFDFILMLYFIERLLYRLSISEYKEKFVLKGGLFLYTVLDEKARATKDIDLLARETAENLQGLQDIFAEICSIEAEDAIKFDLNSINAEKIKEDADYEGVRIKLTAYLDKSRKVLQFDIAFGDVIVPGAVTIEYPSLLNLDKPIIRAYSIESVVAEKFQAMIYLAEMNSRMKDFYDIYSLSSSFDFDGQVLYEAVSQTLVRRKTILDRYPKVLSEDFAKDKAKQVQWTAFKRRMLSSKEESFEQIMQVIEIFLGPIYDHVFIKKEFDKKWSANQMKWMD